MKTWKKRPQNLLIISPNFFSVLGRAAHTAQEWIFMLEMCLKTQLFSNLWFIVVDMDNEKSSLLMM
jgi:hypothetical protein